MIYRPKLLARYILCFCFVLLSFFSLAQKDHDFMHEQYDALHDSPLQQKFRTIAPVPAGVVYIQRPGEGEEAIREHFRKMKKLGFTNLKQVMSLPDWSLEEIQMNRIVVIISN